MLFEMEKMYNFELYLNLTDYFPTGEKSEKFATVVLDSIHC